MKKRVITILLGIFLTLSIAFYFYATSLSQINPTTIDSLNQLEKSLLKDGYHPSFIVMSAKRHKWHNQFLTYFGAAKNSQHLKGNALDLLILDVNDDGSRDKKDVQIVVSHLEKIIKDQGGIGTYTSEKFFWNSQMIHIDCRGKRARWNR